MQTVKLLGGEKKVQTGISHQQSFGSQKYTTVLKVLSYNVIIIFVSHAGTLRSFSKLGQRYAWLKFNPLFKSLYFTLT